MKKNIKSNSDQKLKILKKKCTLCNNTNLSRIYSVKALPVFQNKAYKLKKTAQEIRKGSINLVTCQNCGFTFNHAFNAKIMNYDKTYHIEQNYSNYFQGHTGEIISFLKKRGFEKKNIIEIGCGKGFFVESLIENGFKSVTGFDPAYEGKNKAVIKDYFGKKYKKIEADLIVLRHVLEHIKFPFEFLQNIIESNQNNGYMYIEVPDFDWILKRKAFWDIYYEHCNYFTKESLRQLFKKCEIKSLFNGQYVCLFGKLDDFNAKIRISNKKKNFQQLTDFEKKISYSSGFLAQKDEVILWGGASKGVTFLNLLDKDKHKIKYVIDISPKKHNKFLPGTGHRIFPPEKLSKIKIQNSLLIIITNENYLDEIKETVFSFIPKTKVKFMVL
jgi:2-polyprenyl-3-methyl-5-hydroxy-6-metoxy-1,4-benzoquinol methylase